MTDGCRIGGYHITYSFFFSVHGRIWSGFEGLDLGPWFDSVLFRIYS